MEGSPWQVINVFIGKQIFQDPPDAEEDIFQFCNLSNIAIFPHWYMNLYPSGKPGKLSHTTRAMKGTFIYKEGRMTFDWRDVRIFARVQQGLTSTNSVKQLHIKRL